ncbi:MAG: Dabb family protein [Planctomycetaceae bacterium]
MKRLIPSSLLILCSMTILTLMQTPKAQSEPAANARVLRHLVLLNFKDDAEDAQVRQVVKAFGELPSKIDEIQDFEWGREESVEKLTKGFTHCFLVTFKSQEDLKAYLPHAAHLDFVKLLGPVMEDVLVLDYWTNE